jgi:hypothetical protein
LNLSFFFSKITKLKTKSKHIYKFFKNKWGQNRLDYLVAGLFNIPRILMNNLDFEDLNIFLIIKAVVTYIKNKIVFIFKLNHLKNQKDIKVLVTGAGRSCTTWVAQICYSTGRFDFQIKHEDTLFPWRIILRPNYGSKIATEKIGFIKSMLEKKMQFYKDLKIIWCFKHPVANAMAKIVRGRPVSIGGDFEYSFLASDATLETSILAVKKSFNLFSYFKSKFPNRVLSVKLEDLILNSEKKLKEICEFLNIPYDFDYLLSFKNTPHKYQRKRYGGAIDESQAKIFENWRTAYNGFFKNKKKDIKILIDELKEICRKLDYSVKLIR